MYSRVLVVLQFALLAALVMPDGPRTWFPAPMLLFGLGLAVGIWAVTANRPGNFNIRPDPKPQGRLVDSGPYRYVRHPMYLAVLIVALGLVVADPGWWRVAAFVALLVVLHAKAAFEERALTALHPGYAAYRKRTARLLPFWW